MSTDLCKNKLHPMTPDNVKVVKGKNGNEWRLCLACRRESQKRHDSGPRAKECARVGCPNVFHIEGRAPRTGPTRKRYCSPTCRRADAAIRWGLHSKQAGPGWKFWSVVCKNGHIRTPENTTIHQGSRQCLECNRIRDKARYEREKEKRTQQSARYYQEHKEEINEKRRRRYRQRTQHKRNINRSTTVLQ